MGCQAVVSCAAQATHTTKLHNVDAWTKRFERFAPSADRLGQIYIEFCSRFRVGFSLCWCCGCCYWQRVWSPVYSTMSRPWDDDDGFGGGDDKGKALLSPDGEPAPPGSHPKLQHTESSRAAAFMAQDSVTVMSKPHRQPHTPCSISVTSQSDTERERQYFTVAKNYLQRSESV